MLLEKGYRVHILEKWDSIQKQDDIKEDLQPTITAIKTNERAKFFFETDLIDFYGWCGDYKITLSDLVEEKVITVGGGYTLCWR